ncbi:MAG TPA: L,D-transpeptidase family protein [bacterium]|nr:L,D-transpeptidase family protein [bacterium]
MKRFLITLVAVCSTPVLFSATPPHFSAVINISADSTENVILVDKARQQLYVVRSPGPGELQMVKSYRVTTGRINGDKQKEGDLKTPEGIYYIVSSISGERLPSKYGPLALVLNYPNMVDLLLNKTGSNIWIHGRDEKIQDFQTEGCVSLENGNVLNLLTYVSRDKTPIIINDSLRTFGEQEYNLLGDFWKRRLETWAQAWENGDTLTYFNYYSQLYNDGSLNYREFKEKKTYLESVYDWKSVQVADIVLLYSKNEAHLSFTQSYICPNFFSKGKKRLTLVSRDSDWRIVNEEYSPLQKTQYTKQFLTDFVNSWQRAWESKDIDSYIALYHPDFQTEEYDHRGWYEYKQDIFAQSNDIQVNVSNLTYRSVEKLVWEVSFNQAYSSDDYSDYGRKTLMVRGKPGNMQIFEETWRALSGEE